MIQPHVRQALESRVRYLKSWIADKENVLKQYQDETDAIKGELSAILKYLGSDGE